jgi:hypothetical protein
MDRLRREHGRELIGALFVIAAVVVLIVGYADIRNEIFVAIQLPAVLISGIGAVILVAVGVAVLRSADDKAILRRLAELESTNHELSERIGYLGRLLELAILPGEADLPSTAATSAAEAVDLPVTAQAR